MTPIFLWHVRKDGKILTPFVFFAMNRVGFLEPKASMLGCCGSFLEE